MSARGYTVYLIPNQTVKIEIPVNEFAGEGFFAQVQNNDGTTPATVPIRDELKTLQNGFCVDNEKAGRIVKVYSDAVAIDYKHILGLENTIYFFAATGEWGYVEVSSVPIHDHSTIVQGGPAYGTYFTRVDGEEA